MGLHPLISVDVKSTRNIKNGLSLWYAENVYMQLECVLIKSWLVLNIAYIFIVTKIWYFSWINLFKCKEFIPENN